MLIANPLYDVVFKYLLDDKKVARLFIGVILGVEISELEFKPQEIPIVFSKSDEMDETKTLVQVLRIDFKARITYPNGTSMLVLIELQKVKIDTDMMRFRKYLGSQYADPKNIVTIEGRRMPLPIITIYFLGYSLRNFEQSPILKIKRAYIDNFNQEVLLQKDSFIEALSHDTIIIQLPQIKHKRRNELEQILSIFEVQSIQTFEMKFPIPEQYIEIVKRLNLAVTDEEVRYAMEAQEAMENDYNSKDIALEEERKLKEEALLKISEAMKKLKKSGMNSTEISAIFNLSELEVSRLIS